MTHKLRSILSQYEYSYQVRQWDNEGVPFRTHIYVPEMHPISQMPFCEREDEAHVLKVSAYSYTVRKSANFDAVNRNLFYILVHWHAYDNLYNFLEDCQTHSSWRT